MVKEPNRRLVPDPTATDTTAPARRVRDAVASGVRIDDDDWLDPVASAPVADARLPPSRRGWQGTSRWRAAPASSWSGSVPSRSRPQAAGP